MTVGSDQSEQPTAQATIPARSHTTSTEMFLTNTDANGNITTNTYDALNRVLTSKTVNSGDSSKNVSKSYEYDSMGRVTKNP